MSIWEDFFTVSPPLDEGIQVELALEISLAPWPFPDEVKTGYSVALYRRIFSLLKKARLPIGNLKFTPPELALAINAHHRATGRGGKVGWFVVSYSQPGSEFAVHIDEDTIQLRFFRKSLRDLVRCVSTIGVGITESLLEDELENPIQIINRASTVGFAFEHQIDLGTHKISNEELYNYQIMVDAFSLNQGEAREGELSPSRAIPSLGIDKFIRIDYNQHALMEFKGHHYNAFIGIEAPWNVTQKRIDVKSHVRMEEEFDIRFPEALDWEVPMIHFYRDTVLQRFFANFLAYANYSFKG